MGWKCDVGHTVLTNGWSCPICNKALLDENTALKAKLQELIDENNQLRKALLLPKD